MLMPGILSRNAFTLAAAVLVVDVCRYNSARQPVDRASERVVTVVV